MPPEAIVVGLLDGLVVLTVDETPKLDNAELVAALII
jgi:hypothetical protein